MMQLERYQWKQRRFNMDETMPY